jgi:septal ring factor EnvC (AmiA/AmiB activator)
MPEWDGTERRIDTDWLRDKQKVLSDIKDTKDDVKDIKEDVMDIKITLAELKVEIKQIVNKSATTTSSWISLAVSIISGIAIYFITGTKP